MRTEPAAQQLGNQLRLADKRLEQALRVALGKLRPMFVRTIGQTARERDLERGEPHQFVAIVDMSVERRSEEHTSELQSLMRISYAVFCLKKKNASALRQ